MKLTKQERDFYKLGFGFGKLGQKVNVWPKKYQHLADLGFKHAIENKTEIFNKIDKEELELINNRLWLLVIAIIILFVGLAIFRQLYFDVNC